MLAVKKVLRFDPVHNALVGGCVGAAAFASWKCAAALLKGFSAPRRERDDFTTNLRETLWTTVVDTCIGAVEGLGLGALIGVSWPVSGGVFGLVVVCSGTRALKHKLQDYTSQHD